MYKEATIYILFHSVVNKKPVLQSWLKKCLSVSYDMAYTIYYNVLLTSQSTLAFYSEYINKYGNL